MDTRIEWMILIWVIKLCIVIGRTEFVPAVGDCPWEKDSDIIYPTHEVSFDEFRFSNESKIKIVDTFNSPILSTMFLARDTFVVDFENLDRDSSCPSWKSFCHDNNNGGYCDIYESNCVVPVEGTWLQSLDLSDNKFQTIHSNSFTKISKCLDHLILSHNQISAIESLAFNDLQDLEFLDLSRNNLSSFDFNLVRASPLHHLALNSNYLSSIVNYEINNNLIYLQLQNNLLRTIEIFEMLKLQDLDLSNNKLTEFKVNNIPKLTTLNLSHNKLKHFDGIQSLTKLNLSHNKIVNFSCTEFQFLRSLDLSNNKISHLSSNLFNYLPHLETLDVSYNNLNLMSGMFNELRSLRSLSLQKNHLAVVPRNTFDGLESLKDLDLSQNYIHQLQFGSFFGIKQLQKLDLSYNNLMEIEFDKLLDLNNLKELIIDGNNCTLDLTDLPFKLPALSSLSLGHIPWKCKDLVALTVSLRKFHIETLSQVHNEDVKSAVNGIACYSEDKVLVYYDIPIEDIANDSIENFDGQKWVVSTTIGSVLKSPTKTRVPPVFYEEEPLMLQLIRQAIQDIVGVETNKIKTDLTEQIKNSTWRILQKIDNSYLPKLHTKLLFEKDSEPTYADYVTET